MIAAGADITESEIASIEWGYQNENNGGNQRMKSRPEVMIGLSREVRKYFSYLPRFVAERQS